MAIFAKIIKKIQTVQTVCYSDKKINRLILRLAIPAICSNITVPLLGLSDTFISGHMGGEKFLAAIAVGTMMVNSIYWLWGFLRMGTTGLTAEAFGAEDHEGCRRIFTASFMLGFFSGMVLLLLAYPLSRLILAIMDPQPDTALLAARYFMISLASAPAFLATMAVNGWMIGRQNTLYTMITAITVNVVNILLSLTFVFACGWGFIGVATGTSLANWIGLGVALALARRMAAGEPLWAPMREVRAKLDLRRFFRVNSDLLLRSATLMSVFFAMTAFAGRMGNLVLAQNAILMQFFMFFSYFMDGFAYSAEALCGRFAGAADRPSIGATIRGLAMWSAAMCVVFTLVFGCFTPQIAALLTDSAEVVAQIVTMRWVVLAIPVMSAAAFILDGVFIGLTDTARLLTSTVVAMAIYFAVYLLTPLACPTSIINHNALLWCAFLSFLLARGAVLAICLRSSISRRLSRAME